MKCTKIIITHRLSTIKKADKIFVMHEGQIIESGTHLDLLEKRNVYYKLVKLQLHKPEPVRKYVL